MNANALIKHLDVQPKPFKRGGITHRPRHSEGIFNARVEIIEGKRTITIDGTQTNHVKGPQQFERSFVVGDRAIYDRFNLIYTGIITAIGPASVTIQHYPGQREVTRLDVFNFIRYNWNFDAPKVDAYNAEELQCL